VKDVPVTDPVTDPDLGAESSTRSAPRPAPKRPTSLVLLILFQAMCTAFFVFDVVEDLTQGGVSILHLVPEMAATLGLILGLVFEVRSLMALLRRQAHMEKSLGVAAGALAELMEDYFRQWSLTPSEADVAAFTIKGYSIAEIATMRGSAEGTVKTHLNAIYRKAGVQGRGQLVSLLIEDLLNGPLVPGPGAARG
jgi:DNA-binding CsgD family transcriptional regulator